MRTWSPTPAGSELARGRAGARPARELAVIVWLQLALRRADTALWPSGAPRVRAGADRGTDRGCGHSREAAARRAHRDSRQVSANIVTTMSAAFSSSC